MSGGRGVASALVLSLVLHGAIATTLRALGFGRSSAASPRGLLAPLVVDLIEPVVALSDRGAVEANALAPPRAVVLRGRAERRDVGPPRGASARPSEVVPAPDGSLPSPSAPLRVAEVAPPLAVPTLAPPAPLPVPEPPASATPAVAAPEALELSISALPEAVEPWRSDTAPVEGVISGATGGGESHGPLDGVAGTDENGAASSGVGRVAPRSASLQSAGSTAGEGRISGSERLSGAVTHGPPEIVALPRGASIPPEYDGYLRALRQRIQERLVYPWLAARQRVHGVVELEVQLDPEGRLARASVVGGGGAGPLRDAALRAVRDATPFPFPTGVVARPLTIRLPVIFELR